MKKQICMLTTAVLCMLSAAPATSAEQDTVYPETIHSLKQVSPECKLFADNIYYGTVEETGSAYFYAFFPGKLEFRIRFAPATDKDRVMEFAKQVCPDWSMVWVPERLTDTPELSAEPQSAKVTAAEAGTAAETLCRTLETNFVVQSVKYDTVHLDGSPIYSLSYGLVLSERYHELAPDGSAPETVFAAVRQIYEETGKKPEYSMQPESNTVYLEQENIRLTGDITGEGKIDLRDAEESMIHYNMNEMDMDYLEGDALTAADVTGNRKVDLDDAIAIMQYYNLNDIADMPTSWGKIAQSMDPYAVKQKAEYDAFMEKTVSDQPYKDVIQSTVSDNIFMHLGNQFNPWQSNVDTPMSMNERYPIELIRVVDDNRMYAIQKPESGGLFYSFYVYNGLYCTAYITKSLSFADYIAIKTGSSIDDVIAIEPATQAYIKRLKMYEELTPNEPRSGDFTQHILLKDGLLKLTYKRSGDTWLVNEIDFFDDFKESFDYGMDFLSVYDYSIFPEDYPN